MLFIRNRRFAYIVCIGFLNEEYLIASVDFIVALRRTKGRRRRTLRSPSPPSSGLHLLTPGLSAAAGHYCCRGFGTILESGIRCRSIIPTSTYRLGALCSGLDCSRFRKSRWAYVFRFSLLGGWTVRACGYGRFWLWSIVGFALTAIGSIVWVGNGMGYLYR